MSKPRPGLPLANAERLAGLLASAVDDLEMLQVPAPHPAVEGVIATLRYVRGVLLKGLREAGQ
jgi:hypothetical protein